MGANDIDIDGYREQPMSVSAFAAALAQLDSELEEAGSADTVQAWVNRLHPESAAVEATLKVAAWSSAHGE